ncbi:GNAT family N-acetyltransferase [Arenibacter aquaticus]|uniref:GNAT family N-acetyltransferase n=1 Tax=Arenibacter aquaticus TaxID=2489054 RepID=A0A430K0T4_9FLAO|nr:GNAT family N-acetyltransferase [Arenibacter aquaticus]RTE52658.1 GNAT family N-acetyltransferase [Arenibacter aquaticus]
MEQYTIRKATLTDLMTLKSFEQEIIRAERPYDPTLDEHPISYYDLRELILSNSAIVMVAEINARLIGSGYGQIREAKSYLIHESYAYLGFMYTHPGYRGKGVNKAIVEALKDWSKSKGLTEIRLTVYKDNTKAIKAYEKAGFREHIVEMRTEVNL